MWPFFCATPPTPPTPSIRRNGPMTPEKTHFQNPGCWPAREEGAGVAATASARGGLAPLSTETAFVCHSPIFSTRIFPLFLLPILFLRVSQSLFTASLQLEPLGKRWRWTWLSMAAPAPAVAGGPGSLEHLFPVPFPGKRQPLLHALVRLKIPKDHFQSNCILLSFLTPIKKLKKKKKGWKGRKSEDKEDNMPRTDFETDLVNIFLCSFLWACCYKDKRIQLKLTPGVEWREYWNSCARNECTSRTSSCSNCGILF